MAAGNSDAMTILSLVVPALVCIKIKNQMKKAENQLCALK